MGEPQGVRLEVLEKSRVSVQQINGRKRQVFKTGDSFRVDHATAKKLLGRKPPSVRKYVAPKVGSKAEALAPAGEAKPKGRVLDAAARLYNRIFAGDNVTDQARAHIEEEVSRVGQDAALKALEAVGVKTLAELDGKTGRAYAEALDKLPNVEQ